MQPYCLRPHIIAMSGTSPFYVDVVLCGLLGTPCHLIDSAIHDF